jgi:tetratricopeptide (TPR) repeat protein
MTGRQDLFDESMRLGHSAAWDLQWDKAIEYYRKALAESPENPTALSSLALALLETNQLEQALLAYQRTAEASPDDPVPVEKAAEIHESMGHRDISMQQRELAADMYIRRKDAGKAVDNWTQIARLSPENLSARSRLALTYERLGRTKDSVHEYLCVSSILQAQGKTESAKEALQRALTISPGDEQVNKCLRSLQRNENLPPPFPPRGATAPLRMSKVQDIMQTDVETTTDADGQFADPEASAQSEAMTILAGLLFDESTDFDEGKERTLDMSDISSGKTDPDHRPIGRPSMLRFLGTAIDLQTRGHKDKAAKEFATAIKKGLDHPAAHYNLGLLLKETQEYDEAKKHLSAAIGHPGLALGANLALGRIARMEQDVPEAARFLLQALRIADGMTVGEDQSSQLNQFYDGILATQSDGDEENLSRIVESTLDFLSGPQWMQRLREARQQLEVGQTGSTVVPIAEMLAVGSADKMLKALTRIDELAEQGHYPSSMEEAMLAIDYAPTYLALHNRMANLQIKAGRVDEGFDKLSMIAETHRIRGESSQASEMYLRILEHSPVNVRARRELIELLTQQDRIDEAMEHYVELAEIYRQMAEIDTARDVLSESLQLAQRSSVSREWPLKVLHMLGDMALSRLDQRKALAVYQQVVELDPSDDKARGHVIDLNLRLGQEDEAALALDNYLEYLVQAERSGEALNLLEDMAREHPGKQALHSRLAEAYKAAGRTADAIAQYDALGEIQLDAGQVEEATRSIQAILDLDPPDVDGYVELLKNLKAGK